MEYTFMHKSASNIKIAFIATWEQLPNDSIYTSQEFSSGMDIVKSIQEKFPSIIWIN